MDGANEPELWTVEAMDDVGLVDSYMINLQAQ